MKMFNERKIRPNWDEKLRMNKNNSKFFISKNFEIDISLKTMVLEENLKYRLEICSFMILEDNILYSQ
jgi:hypothetical protein